ncbi:glucokinase [Marinobacter oulmenensis]|uniref:Glucokinase n=1 Tax=Marinobacter oulmenensis TaxID=643747 RepID=A0A840UP57_9GAMM|nr:glucokinase [Marinobacter oulmenensis]MBB5322408.1 glucokinase [Marinobacter oulmenensis]
MTAGNWSLVGDIGGTNARFALVQAGDSRLHCPLSLATTDYETVEQALDVYLDEAGRPWIDAACLAVAGPVRLREARLTNGQWAFSIPQLKQAFGWSRLDVINDYHAMALGVLQVPDSGLVAVAEGQRGLAPRLVMGPGTGLGMAALIPSDGGWLPLVTEGGHVDFPVVTGTEVEILRILQRRFGRVSVERILSGEGLLALYRAHADIRGVTAVLQAPELITAAASAGDGLAVTALMHFCELLGRTAGNAVLTLGAFGGVYLTGGIVTRFPEFLIRSPFAKGFTDKGRMAMLLRETPVHIVMEPQTGLMGAAKALEATS